MPNIKSAKKRVKTNELKGIRNKDQIASMRTAEKKVKLAVKEGNKDKVEELLKDANKKLDKAAGKGLIKKNKAARDKAKLAKAAKSVK